jgi:hypothetical protein
MSWNSPRESSNEGNHVADNVGLSFHCCRRIWEHANHLAASGLERSSRCSGEEGVVSQVPKERYFTVALFKSFVIVFVIVSAKVLGSRNPCRVQYFV